MAIHNIGDSAVEFYRVCPVPQLPDVIDQEQTIFASIS